MLKLFIGNKNYSSWSLRPWVLMRQLAIPFEETVVPFGHEAPGTAYGTFSPSGRVPCLFDRELVVWDSLAIAEYLAEREPKVWPSDPTARAWARCASAEMHSGFSELRNRCPMNCGLRIRLHSYTPALHRDFHRLDELWNQGLNRFGGPFLAGKNFTAVDAFYCPVAFRIQTYSPPISDAARQYAERLLALPAMRDWYEAALAEPWREAEHEAEVRAVGIGLNDYRR